MSRGPSLSRSRCSALKYYVETKFGRVVSNSSAGAHDPDAVLVVDVAAYGLVGDIHDPNVYHSNPR
jgi:hypothetical protein